MGKLICQICFKFGHTDDVCWHRFVQDYVPSSRGFGKGKAPRATYFSNSDVSAASPDFVGYENFNIMFLGYDSIYGSGYYYGMDAYTPRATFMANFEETADD